MYSKRDLFNAIGVGREVRKAEGQNPDKNIVFTDSLDLGKIKGGQAVAVLTHAQGMAAESERNMDIRGDKVKVTTFSEAYLKEFANENNLKLLPYSDDCNTYNIAVLYSEAPEVPSPENKEGKEPEDKKPDGKAPEAVAEPVENKKFGFKKP